MKLLTRKRQIECQRHCYVSSITVLAKTNHNWSWCSLQCCRWFQGTRTTGLSPGAATQLMRSKNLYTPMDIVNIVNKIKSIATTVIDHCHSRRPFYTGWDTILPKSFKNLPSLYTFDYFLNPMKVISAWGISVRHPTSMSPTSSWSSRILKSSEHQFYEIYSDPRLTL